MKYHHEIDILRGFAILSLIIVHVFSYCFAIQDVNTIVIVSIPLIIFSRFAVPVFIFISGYVLYLKYKSYIDYGEFYKKRFIKIIPPYLIFSFLYYLLNNNIINNMSFNIKELMYQLITANAHIHLWFFSLIIQLYLLFPVILFIYNKTKRKLFFVLVIFIVQIIWDLLYPGISENIKGDNSNLSHIVLSDIIFNRRFFLSHIAYLIFGFYYSENRAKFKNSIITK